MRLIKLSKQSLQFLLSEEKKVQKNKKERFSPPAYRNRDQRDKLLELESTSLNWPFQIGDPFATKGKTVSCSFIVHKMCVHLHHRETVKNQTNPRSFKGAIQFNSVCLNYIKSVRASAAMFKVSSVRFTHKSSGILGMLLCVWLLYNSIVHTASRSHTHISSSINSDLWGCVFNAEEGSFLRRRSGTSSSLIQNESGSQTVSRSLLKMRLSSIK